MKHLCLTDRCEMSEVINLIRGTHVNLTYYGGSGTFDLCAHEPQTGGVTIRTRQHDSPLDAYTELRTRMADIHAARAAKPFVPTMKALETQDAVFTETPNGFTVTFK